MAFGEFTLYRGRNAYTVTSMKISDYFSSDMKDIDSMVYGNVLFGTGGLLWQGRH